MSRFVHEPLCRVGWPSEKDEKADIFSLYDWISDSKDRRLARDAVEHASVIDGHVLLRQNLDDLLRDHPSRQRRDVVQLRPPTPRQLHDDIAESLLRSLGVDFHRAALLEFFDDLVGVLRHAPFQLPLLRLLRVFAWLGDRESRRVTLVVVVECQERQVDCDERFLALQFLQNVSGAV